MALVNGTVEDINVDTTLAQSKPKIDGNDEKLIANDIAMDTRIVTVEGGAFVGMSRWDDIIVYPTSLASGASAPDLVSFKGGISLYTFDGVNTIEELYGVFELPHDYKEGTDLRPHLHWSPINANAGNVKWQLEYSKASKDAVFPVTTTISTTNATIGALVHQANEFTAITGTGFKIGDIISFRLFRDPTDVADTYASDVFLLSIGIHYQVDSTGSVNIFTKT